ncbi:ISAs1 family transposase [Saccharopolyspora sp. NPDC000995]
MRECGALSGRRTTGLPGGCGGTRGFRGAGFHTAGKLVHLLSGLCQRSKAVLAQTAVGAKTNEIPVLAALLGTLDITNAVITADAMHCQRDTAQIIRDRGGHYILTVKANQPTLRKRVKSLPWKDIPSLSVTRERGHGRQDTRTLKAPNSPRASGSPAPLRSCDSPGPAPTARPANIPAKPSTPSPVSPSPTPDPNRSPHGCADTGRCRSFAAMNVRRSMPPAGGSEPTYRKLRPISTTAVSADRRSSIRCGGPGHH